jgi:hypothetical protein
VSVELEAEFVGMNNGWVVLQDTKGKSFELRASTTSHLRTSSSFVPSLNLSRMQPWENRSPPGKTTKSKRSNR